MLERDSLPLKPLGQFPKGLKFARRERAFNVKDCHTANTWCANVASERPALTAIQCLKGVRPERYPSRGPLGIGLLGSPGALLFAGDFPFGVRLDASALFIGLRETSLGLRDDLAVRETPVLAMSHARQYGTRRASCVRIEPLRTAVTDQVNLRHYPVTASGKDRTSG